MRVIIFSLITTEKMDSEVQRYVRGFYSQHAVLDYITKNQCKYSERGNTLMEGLRMSMSHPNMGQTATNPVPDPLPDAMDVAVYPAQ